MSSSSCVTPLSLSQHCFTNKDSSALFNSELTCGKTPSARISVPISRESTCPVPSLSKMSNVSRIDCTTRERQRGYAMRRKMLQPRISPEVDLQHCRATATGMRRADAGAGERLLMTHLQHLGLLDRLAVLVAIGGHMLGVHGSLARALR
eukprot:scaffold261504_cov36-Tisochrysis_lutea.AAC.1